MRVSAASTATGSGATSLSFAAVTGRARGASSSCTIALAGRGVVVVGTIMHGIGNPAFDGGFMPSGPVNTDFQLCRERPFGDLAIEGRARQPGAREDGPEADNPFGVRRSEIGRAHV